MRLALCPYCCRLPTTQSDGGVWVTFCQTCSGADAWGFEAKGSTAAESMGDWNYEVAQDWLQTCEVLSK